MICPLCDGNNFQSVFRAEGVPVNQHQLCRTEDIARNIIRGDLDFLYCENCTFIFNAAFDQNKISYNLNYDNNQMYSDTFVQHVSRICAQIPNEERRVVEIGCGDGEFLRRLFQSKDCKYTKGLGIDPSCHSTEGKLTFCSRAFNENDIQKDDIVIARHLIEHLPNPLDDLLQKIRHCYKVIIETPDIQWTLENRFIWDFFYEHCSLFSKFSLLYAFKRSGFNEIGLSKELDGQYLLALTGQKTKKHQDFLGYLRLDMSSIKEQWQNLLKQYCGRVVIWGVGAKGVMFANLIDPNKEFIKYGAELNPSKIGKFIPGTGHEIINCVDVRCCDNIEAVVLMNPVYKNELMSYIGDSRIEILFADRSKE